MPTAPGYYWATQLVGGTEADRVIVQVTTNKVWGLLAWICGMQNPFKMTEFTDWSAQIEDHKK